MSDVLSCAAVNWAEIDEQQVEMLPARTVLSCFCGGPAHGDWGGSGDWGGDGGWGGHGGWGGWGFGGPGGDGGDATVTDNYNYGLVQINIAIAGPGGDGGDGYGGDADGGDGGEGGDA